VKRLSLIPLVLIIACLEERAIDQFNATVARLCVTPPLASTIDQHLHAHAEGCVLVSLEKPLAAGLDEVGVEPGVYRTQATSLGFTHYRDEVLVARYADTLAVMTPAAFQELAQAAGAVHEAQLKEQHLREGLGLVIWGNLQAFGPAEPRQLTQDQVLLVRKSF
jgi:hypothetical protein